MYAVYPLIFCETLYDLCFSNKVLVYAVSILAYILCQERIPSDAFMSTTLRGYSGGYTDVYAV